jgi:PhnB protein
MSVKPIPQGYTSLTPFLCIDGASLYCEDVDDVVARAEKAGATIREPAQTFVTGDRFALVLDPFGQRWTVMTRVEDVSPEEHDRRMAEWAKENV